MADSSAPVNASAEQPPSNPVTASSGDKALSNNPLADTQTAKPAPVAPGASEPVSSAVTQPLPVVPETHKPVDNSVSAVTTNGNAAAPSGLNGAADKFEPVVPEVSKPASTPAPPVEKPAEASVNNSTGATSDSSPSGQAAVMTSALPLGGQPKSDAPPSESSSQHDGMKDTLAASSTAVGASTAKPEPPAEKESIKDDSTAAPVETAASNSLKTSENNAVNGGDKAKDVDTEMKDVPPAVSAPAAPLTSSLASAPVTDITGTASTTPAAVAVGAGGQVAGEKRKADGEPLADSNGAAAAQEPAAKKHKGPLSKALNKAKEAFDEVKEKASPARKNNKKAKKDPAPVGRTERKTRSQGRAE